MLILVRHAMPAYRESVPADAWSLAPDGIEAADALCATLPASAHLVASAEPKAWQTLRARGEVVRDARFGEVRRSGEPWDGRFRELRRAYVEGADHSGWEPRTAVAARFDAGVIEHRAVAAGRDLVIATHGMAMTVWLTSRIGLPSPGEFWAGLRFPDAVVVDVAAGTVSGFGPLG